MTYRVIEWATENGGGLQLAQSLDDPDIEPVGGYVYGDAKVGRDAGELIGRSPVGCSPLPTSRRSSASMPASCRTRR
jgi:hypothetical protein